MESDEEELSGSSKKDKEKKESEPEPEPTPVEEEKEPGCCCGWLGLCYVADKVGGIFVEDPIETITACITRAL